MIECLCVSVYVLMCIRWCASLVEKQTPHIMTYQVLSQEWREITRQMVRERERGGGRVYVVEWVCMCIFLCVCMYVQSKVEHSETTVISLHPVYFISEFYDLCSEKTTVLCTIRNLSNPTFDTAFPIKVIVFFISLIMDQSYLLFFKIFWVSKV